MTGTNENFKVGRVMIVDDEPELLNALCDALTGQGYEARGYTSGVDALRELAEQDCDLLLTDMMMPEMDGIVLLKAALDIDPNVVGVIMTGHGTVQTAVEAMKLGAFDYMLKPFKLATLLPLLSRAMEVRHLRMENMQLHETVAIHELGKAIAFSSDLSDILSKVADAALHQCQADEASIMLPTRDGKELYVAVVRGGHGSYLGERMPLDQGVAGWVARNREPLVMHGEVEDQRFSPVKARADIRSAVSMPMLAGGNLVGVLNVNVTRPGHRHFTLGQVKALSVLVSIIAPMLENSRLYKQLRQAEEKYRSIFENAIEGIFQSTPEGQFITANPALAAMLGYASPEELMSTLTDVARQLYVDPTERAKLLSLIATHGRVERYESRFYRRDGRIIWVSFNIQAVYDEKRQLLRYEGMLEDISQRKRIERQQGLNNKILQTLNRPNEIIHLIRDILLALKEHTDIEAIAIRLQEGDDFPYYETSGFPHSFLKAERYLCSRDSAGEIVCDAPGSPVLECMCGNVIRGRIDPTLPFFTTGGSFWTNSTTELLAATTEQDRQARTRNRCHGEGYESVALIPLRSGGAIIGLLQLNDRRRDAFTIQTIRFLEEIGTSIGIALARNKANDELQEALDRYRSLAANVDSMYLVDESGTYLFINEGHLRRFGLAPEDVVGKKYSEFHSEEETKWFKEVVGIVLKTGKSLTKEHRSERDGKYFLRTFTPVTDNRANGQMSQVAVISKDISEIKFAEKQLLGTFANLKKALQTIIQVMVSTVEARDPYTAGHQVRTANLACAIAEEMGLSADKIEGIRMGGSIHDIGKMSIPAEILSKPTKLSELEFALIKEHASTGYEMLKDVESPWPLAEIVHQHHERIDGSGYPQHLKGEEICLEARILGLADVVEAMASHRPYRASLGIDAALKEIEKNRGTFYDEAVVDACLKLFREKGFKLTGV